MAIDNVYGNKLVLDITGFKSKIKDATVVSENFGKQLEKTRKFSRDVFGNIVDVRAGSEEIAKQNKLYAEQVKSLMQINNLRKNSSALSGLGSVSFAEGGNYTGYIANFKNTTKDATEEVNDLGNATEDMASKSNRLGGEISKSFTKGLKSVKKLTIGFLGARSVFMLFRKYMGEYSSQNEEFANKMKLTSSVIANTLAPAFEWFANIVQYTVIGLARIIELLTGINILGKASDKTFKGASKSAKEFNDNLSGLDEISNINESGGGLSSGIGSQLKALSDFQNKIKEVDEWLEKSGIKKFLTDLRPLVKEVFGWISEHPLGTLGLLAGLKALKGILSLTLGVKGGTTGLFGLLTVLSELAVIGVVTVGVVWAKGEVDKSNEDALEFSEKMKDNIKEVKDNILKMEDIFKKDPSKQNLSGLITQYEIQISNFESAIRGLKRNLDLKSWILDPAGYYEIKNQVKDYEGQLNTLKEKTEGLRKTLKETSDDTVVDINEVKQNLINLVHGGGGRNHAYELKIDIDTKQASNKLSLLAEEIKQFMKKGISGVSGLFNSYDVGTDYVSHDQLAFIHEGERIIPKKYNNSEYLGQMGNSETNALLIELNRSVLEFAKRPSVINVNGKDLAKATYSDYQEEGSRRGTNTSVRRV